MAILKRGKPRGFLRKIKESIWPSQGWGRTYSYYKHRVFRGGDSAHKITAGLACGASVSFTPFLGTHFAQALFFSWLMRANLMAGFIGTAWGNPWTFPFIFWLDYHVGMSISTFLGLLEFVELPAGMDFSYFMDRPGEFLNYLFSNPLKLLLPMTLGGIVCGVLFWPIAYLSLYYPVNILRKVYQRERMKRIYAKAARKKK